MDHYILLWKYLSNHMHFITNGFKRFSKTNSSDPRRRVPLKVLYRIGREKLYKLLQTAYKPYKWYKWKHIFLVTLIITTLLSTLASFNKNIEYIFREALDTMSSTCLHGYSILNHSQLWTLLKSTESMEKDKVGSGRLKKVITMFWHLAGLVKTSSRLNQSERMFRTW